MQKIDAVMDSDRLDYLIGQFTGGVGRTILGTSRTIQAAAEGTLNELPTYRIPLLGRFYGDATGKSSEAAKFYSNLKRINGHQRELKGLRSEKDLAPDAKAARIAEYMRENPEARLALFTQRLESDLAQAKKLKKDMEERGASKDALKAADARITGLMATLNKRVDALRNAPEEVGQ